MLGAVDKTPGSLNRGKVSDLPLIEHSLQFVESHEKQVPRR